MVNLSGSKPGSKTRLGGSETPPADSTSSLESTPSPAQSEEALLTQSALAGDDEAGRRDVVGREDDVRRRLFHCLNCKELEAEILGERTVRVCFFHPWLLVCLLIWVPSDREAGVVSLDVKLAQGVP